MPSGKQTLNNTFLSKTLVNANLTSSCLILRLLLHLVYLKSLKRGIAKSSIGDPQILAVMLNLTFLIQRSSRRKINPKPQQKSSI